MQSKIMKTSRERILKCIHSKIMKDCVEDTFNTILVSTVLFNVMLQFNSLFTTLKKNSFFTKQTFLNLFQTFFNFFPFFIFSFIVNWLGLKAFQTYQTVYLNNGKTCFHSTNDNVLLLFFWRRKLWQHNCWQVLYF